MDSSTWIRLTCVRPRSWAISYASGSAWTLQFELVRGMTKAPTRYGRKATLLHLQTYALRVKSCIVALLHGRIVALLRGVPSSTMGILAWVVLQRASRRLRGPQVER